MQRPLAQLALRPGLALGIQISVAAPVTDAAHDEVVAGNALEAHAVSGEMTVGGRVGEEHEIDDREQRDHEHQSK